MPFPVAIVPAHFVGSAKKNLAKFPKAVRRDIGRAILFAQYGGTADNAKRLRQFGSGVLEVVENHYKDTYRAVYTVRFKDRIYVLHCFQKKSRRGIKTDQKDKILIEQRLKMAAAHHKDVQRAP